ncbi:MAG: UPF0104 family protein [Actinobacteria bacterium]|nr:UPF0104 family protein [Actinomycetota bacterium]
MNGAPKRRRSSGLRSTFRWAKWPIFLLVFWLFILPIVPGFGDALSELGQVKTSWLMLGIALEFAALFSYSMLTHVALGQDADKVSVLTLFRIQLSTRSLGSLVPGGSAASNALGFRLMTLAGANGRDAGFALATAGVGSAVVLNLILWVSLIVSIPGRGVNAFYGTAAIFGVIVMLLAGGVVLGLIDHEGRAERVTRAVAKRLRFDPDKAGEVAVHLGERLRGLANEPGLLRKVFMWSLLNWALFCRSSHFVQPIHNDWCESCCPPPRIAATTSTRLLAAMQICRSATTNSKPHQPASATKTELFDNSKHSQSRSLSTDQNQQATEYKFPRQCRAHQA